MAGSYKRPERSRLVAAAGAAAAEFGINEVVPSSPRDRRVAEARPGSRGGRPLVCRSRVACLRGLRGSLANHGSGCKADRRDVRINGRAG